MNCKMISKCFFILLSYLAVFSVSAGAITLDDFVTGQNVTATESNQKVSNSISSGQYIGQIRLMETFFGARKDTSLEPYVALSSGYGFNKDQLFFKNYYTSGKAVITWQTAQQSPVNLYSGDACAFVLNGLQAYWEPTTDYPITITLLDSNNAQKTYSFKLTNSYHPTTLTIPFAQFIGDSSFSFASVVRISIQIESECPWAWLWIKSFGTNENDKSCLPKCVETDNTDIIDQLTTSLKAQQKVNNTLVRCFVRRTELDRGKCRTRYQRQSKASLANAQAALATISQTTLQCPPHPMCTQVNVNGAAIEALLAEARSIYRAYQQLTKCYWRSVNGGICSRPLTIPGVARIRPRNCPGNVCGDCEQRVDSRQSAVRKLSREARATLRKIIALTAQISAESSVCQ